MGSSTRFNKWRLLQQDSNCVIVKAHAENEEQQVREHSAVANLNENGRAIPPRMEALLHRRSANVSITYKEVYGIQRFADVQTYAARTR